MQNWKEVNILIEILQWQSEKVGLKSFDKDEILANHRSFMTSLNIPSGKE
jgi:hypothetical protein